MILKRSTALERPIKITFRDLDSSLLGAHSANMFVRAYECLVNMVLSGALLFA